MSGQGNRGTISSFILGSIGVLSVSALVYYFFFFKSSLPAIANKPISLSTASQQKKENSSTAVEDVAVEDDDEDDNEDDEEDGDEAAVKLKEQYDAANKLANKYVKGASPAAFLKAVEKLSEALELAPKIPSASRDVSTLYNNRSAMYEKLSMYDKSLADITVVLAMDKYHQKARVRRARINETQGKLKEAVADYAFVNMMQQHKGQAPEFSYKMEELVKSIAKSETPKTLQSIRYNAAKATTTADTTTAAADTAATTDVATATANSSNSHSNSIGISSSGGRPLPSKAHCRNFFESHPTIYSWKEFYKSTTAEKLADVLEQLLTSSNDATETAVTAAQLDIVCFHIVNNKFKEAFSQLQCVKTPTTAAATTAADVAALPETTTATTTAAVTSVLAPYLQQTTCVPERLASLIYELKAAELHLKCSIEEAAAAYREALAYCPENFDARLKLADLLSESGQPSVAMAMHEDIANYCNNLSSIYSATATTAATTAAAGVESKEGQEGAVTAADNVTAVTAVDIMKAWSLLHRAAIHLTRDESGKYLDGAVARALADIDEVLELTQGIQEPLSMKAARLNALIRSVYVLSQSKPMTGEVTTDEDVARNALSMAEAKSLFPDNDATLLMEAELVSQENKWDEAAALIQRAVALPSAIPGDCTPVFVSAALLASKAMTMMMSGTMSIEDCKKLFQEADEKYQSALLLEPNAIEVLSQYAQYKSTMGQYSEAVEMLQDALLLARTRDDVHDLLQLLSLNEAHNAATKEFLA